MLGAATSVAAGVLVHYSAGPYALFLAGYHLVAVRRPAVRGTATAAGTALFLLGTWFGWSLAKLGTADTFASNPTVTDTRALSPRENVAKLATNTFATLVPHALTAPVSGVRKALLATEPGMLRDYFFHLYQTEPVR